LIRFIQSRSMNKAVIGSDRRRASVLMLRQGHEPPPVAQARELVDHGLVP
jgi:hypothetical protein